MPLPPYIVRQRQLTGDIAQRRRFALSDGLCQSARSVAAPDGRGCISTDTLLAELSRRGIEIHSVTLHVGPGTFLPPATTIRKTCDARRALPHPRDRRATRLPERDARTKSAGDWHNGGAHARICDERRRKRADTRYRTVAESFIYPPSAVGSLCVSRLSCAAVALAVTIDAADAGREKRSLVAGWLAVAYARAIAARYRTDSYGDAMLCRSDVDCARHDSIAQNRRLVSQAEHELLRRRRLTDRSISSTDGMAKRAGRLLLPPHGVVKTPIFMPVMGRSAASKAMTVPERRSSVRRSSSATYHLWLRPGMDVISARRSASLHDIKRPC